MLRIVYSYLLMLNVRLNYTSLTTFQQQTEFEWGKIIDLGEEVFSYRVIAALVQRNSSREMPV